MSLTRCRHCNAGHICHVDTDTTQFRVLRDKLRERHWKKIVSGYVFVPRTDSAGNEYQAYVLADQEFCDDDDQPWPCSTEQTILECEGHD